MDLLKDLKDFMDTVEIKELEITPDESGKFEIISDNQANFFVRKVMDMRAEEEKIIKTADEEIKRLTTTIREWQEKELESINKTSSYFEDILRAYTEEKLKGSSKKSFKLPYGTLAFRGQRPKFTYDDDKIIKSLGKESEYVKRTVDYKLDKVKFKGAGEIKDGEFYIDNKKVDGVEVEILEDKFEIK